MNRNTIWWGIFLAILTVAGFAALTSDPPDPELSALEDTLEELKRRSAERERRETWVWVRDVDPMTDENASYASVSLDIDLFTNPAMTVQCNQQSRTGYYIFVFFDDYIGSEPRAPRWRFDGLPAESPRNRVLPSTEGTAIYLHEADARRMIPKLRRHEKVLFEIKDYNGTPHRVEFPLRGAAEAIDKLSCVPESPEA